MRAGPKRALEGLSRRHHWAEVGFLLKHAGVFLSPKGEDFNVTVIFVYQGS
jgi:hypothetical protein